MRGLLRAGALLLGLASIASFANAASAASPAPPPAAATPAAGTVEVPVTQDTGGGISVPVTINDSVKLDFMLDSGASVVTLPADVVMTLMRTGTLTRDDYIGDETFQLADGSTVPSTILRIRSLRVGGLELKNVQASVADVKGPLLLGQTFLGRLASWSMDNQRHVLVLGPERPGGGPQLAITRPTNTHGRHPAGNDQAAAAHDFDPGGSAGPAPGASASGRPETAKGIEWDAAFLHDCVPTAVGQGASQSTAAAYCHCVGDLLQPLPLSRKKRLVAHSHEILAAESQCRR